jgi:hypothetical protein
MKCEYGASLEAPRRESIPISESFHDDDTLVTDIDVTSFLRIFHHSSQVQRHD